VSQVKFFEVIKLLINFFWLLKEVFLFYPPLDPYTAKRRLFYASFLELNASIPTPKRRVKPRSLQRGLRRESALREENKKNEEGKSGLLPTLKKLKKGKCFKRRRKWV